MESGLCVASRLGRIARPDTVKDDLEPALGDLPGVQELDRSGGQVAGVGIALFALLVARAALILLELGPRVMKISPRISINFGGGAPATAFSSLGNLWIVSTFAVTSSPSTPLPRVTARTNLPFS